ncbi:MAG TPA: TauD/TfdA family dioxygenase [Terriglobia bacterium]|nr:TauD/TfdA family dioxygenase [Terriglobia bacterium]
MMTQTERHLDVRAPSKGDIGAEILDLDVKTIDSETAQAIKAEVYEHKLVVFRNQQLTRQEYVDFARKLGKPQVYLQKNYHHPEHPEIFVSSNIPENGKKVGVAGTGRYWHTDYQFHPEPLPMTLVYPQVLPRGRRGTSYIDMERAYQELPGDLRPYVDGKCGIHEAKWRYKITSADIDRAIIDILTDIDKVAPAVKHPAVIVHPVTGRKMLYLSSGFSVGLEGLSHEEGRQILARIFDSTEDESPVHFHAWQPGDILLWDNRTLIHKASDTPQGEQSCSYRIGVYDGLPFYAS